MYSPFKHVSFMPYTHDSWTEYWFPIKNTRGLTHATPQGAMNLRVQEGWLKLDYCAVSMVLDTLKVLEGNTLVLAKKLALKPLEMVRDSVKWTGDFASLRIQVGAEILADGRLTNTQRFLGFANKFDWKSDYGMYLHAKDLMNQRNYIKADSIINRLLEKSPSFKPAQVLQAEVNYVRGFTVGAGTVADFVVGDNAYDAKANFIAGMAHEGIGRLTAAKDRFATASLDPTYRAAALYHLAKMEVREKSYAKALALLQQLLERQADHWDAKALEIVMLRLLKSNEAALQKAKEILQNDPLNHLVRFEIARMTQNPEDKQQFMGMIRSELPSETYLEMAISYEKLGLYQESLEVLELSVSNPMVNLWKAYLLDKLNQKTESIKALEAVILASPEGVFPFRNETVEVLKWSLTQKQHWKLRYYRHVATASVRGMHDLQDFMAIERNDTPPDFFSYYLYKAEALKKDKVQVKTALEKAYELAPNSWRTVKALADFYAENGQLKKALDINESRLSKSQRLGKSETPLPDHEVYILGQQRARLLLKLERYKECIELMQSLNILPNEGASGAHALFREANIRYAAELSNRKKYKEAQLYLEQAETWPENLGSGEPYNPDNRLTLYLKKFVNQKLKNRGPDAVDLLKLSKGLSAKEFDLLKLFE